MRIKLASVLGVTVLTACTHHPPPQPYQGLNRVQPFTLPANGFSCPAYHPMPFSKPLIFRSKYEGSNHARATLNKNAEKAYKVAIAPIQSLEKHLAKLSKLATRKKVPPDTIANCMVQALTPWAKAQALTSEQSNHTGASVRKWALASISTNLNVVSHNLAPNDASVTAITQWIDTITQHVINDWSNRPLKKVNNHDYWAAWAVMNSAVLLNNSHYWAWALSKYNEALTQIGPDGFLPNELKRKGRALHYHNYAFTPLIFMYHLAHINGQALDHLPLKRLGLLVVAGLENPTLFERKTKSAQVTDGLYTAHSLAWVPIFKLYFESPAVDKWHARYAPFRSTRLGGDISAQTTRAPSSLSP